MEDNEIISDKYQKKTQREHVLLRPGTYLGNIYDVTETMYVPLRADDDDNSQKMSRTSITYNTGLLKMFDEILMNAVDHARENQSVSTIRIKVNCDSIEIYNDGPGIPIVKHSEHNVYIPELIFSHFLTSSNYDDTQKRLKAGMNGLGAKITSTFSREFIIDTQYKGQWYHQVFNNNLSDIQTPVIRKRRKADYTNVCFAPDFQRFGINEITPETKQVLLKRAYDATVWTSSSKVKVYFNDTLIGIESFSAYVDLYLDDTQTTEKVIVQMPRWNVAICSSTTDQFEQISFVNGVQTHQGGTHVAYILQPILKRLMQKVSKKYPNVRQKHIKDHLMIFVFAEIENPSFKSQAKEELTTRKEDFGSSFDFTEGQLKAIEKLNCVQEIIETLKLQETKSLNTSDGKKTTKLFIEKLDDANKAGTRESLNCTLILTEGDSAKTFATCGLTKLPKGREYFGIFPLKGKLLNVRNATIKQLATNVEIKSLKQILGLQNGKKYKDVASLKRSMRYGRVCLLTDADVDAMHIEGLLINFFHYFWPQLIAEDDSFIVSLPTPVVKAKPSNKRCKTLEFYDLITFDQWIRDNSLANQKKYKIKYYKGLGTSTPQEQREAFEGFETKLVKYSKATEEDASAIELAFRKDLTTERKKWIEDATQRSLSLSVQGSLTISNFIHQGLVQFSIANCRRAIPNLMDGFKPSQRKVLYGFLKKNAWDEVKVDQIRGYIGEQTMYAHGDESLNKTIIAMNHDYVGSNNLNLLLPCGSFGTRLEGGEDAASPRYISTKLNPLVKFIFYSTDAEILTYLNESGEIVEPEFYLPIIPMILVNGSNGIGTGFCTDIPMHDPSDLAKLLLRWLRDSPEQESQLRIRARGFTGTIAQQSLQCYTSNGKWHRVDDCCIRITELPLFTWTQKYKQFLNLLVENSVIENYNDLTTESLVIFDVFAPRLQIEEWIVESKIESVFNLQSRHKINLTCFDAKGALRTYNSTLEILKEFYDSRLHYYDLRYNHLQAEYTKDISCLQNKKRFIQLVMDEDILVFKQTHESIREQLKEYAFPSDQQESFLDLPLHQFTQSYMDTLSKKIADLERSLEELLKMCSKDLWIVDLEELIKQIK